MVSAIRQVWIVRAYCCVRLWITLAFGRICNARADSTYEFRSAGHAWPPMFLILSHLNKFGFGREPATAHCWLESDRHFLDRDLEEPDRIGTDRCL
jgi:hypothetical protein